MATSSAADVWETIAGEAARESALWESSLAREADPVPVFSPLGEDRYALGIETIYEGYLVHYGRPRLFAPADPARALLLGDYLYAHGLVRVAAEGSVDAVGDLAELLSLLGQLRADDREGDGEAWAATAALLGTDGLEAARKALRLDSNPEPLGLLAREAAGAAAVERALAAHRERLR